MNMFQVIGACLLSQTALALTVALDIGHSLNYPGATSARGMPEFQFNLALAKLAKTVKPVLESFGFTVLLTGDQGDMTDLRARARLANNADFFCRCIMIRYGLNTCPGGFPKGNGKFIATCFGFFPILLSLYC